jgi:hypothetical protein
VTPKAAACSHDGAPPPLGCHRLVTEILVVTLPKTPTSKGTMIPVKAE